MSFLVILQCRLIVLKLNSYFFCCFNKLVMDKYHDLERKIFLIQNSLSSELSADERIELEAWLQSSPENQQTYERIRNKQKIAGKLEFYRRTDMEKDWEIIRRSTLSFTRRRLYRRWMSYAAVFAGVIGIAVIFMQREKTEQSAFVNVAATTDTIRPGSKQAYIELVSGEKITLGETEKGLVKNIQGGVLKEEQEGLVMVADNSVKTTLEYNRIVVPRGGEYQLTLADGTKVWLNSDSKLEFPVAFIGGERRVRLQGEAYFQVKRNEKMPFRVEVNRMEVAVLGTSFNIHAYGALMRTTLVEGAVAVKVEGNTVRLTPGEEAEVNAGKVTVEKANVFERIAWKEGKFVFSEKRLEEVMEILGRWYDVEIFYQNAGVKELHFTGNIPRHATIGEVLHFLERTRLVHFHIDGRTVMVFKNK